jgi:tRNA-Thr(GGU) m(6)t(6)A37 methyltransferase TsaA
MDVQLHGPVAGAPRRNLLPVSPRFSSRAFHLSRLCVECLARPRTVAFIRVVLFLHRCAESSLASRRCTSPPHRRNPPELKLDAGVVTRLDIGLPPSLTLQPIGYLRTQQKVKFQAGHQPEAATEARNELELLPGHGYEQAVQDLAGIERVWLLWWFHRNEGWRPLVLPPRGAAHRRGGLATRSPHRPNPLGLSSVMLLGVNGRRLLLGPCDLLDGTPVFDVKPYVAAHDAFPAARAGWIDALEAELREPARFTVTLSAAVTEQSHWLLDPWQINFMPRLFSLLSRDPTPHRTRRIRRRNATHFEIGCGAWRAIFTVNGEKVVVTALESAYPMKFLQRADYHDVPDRAAQLAFRARWSQAL